MSGATERTLLFTDIEGSTQLVERLGDAAAAALWERHDRAARDLRALHNGREIDRTDGFFLLFERAHEAAAFAAAYHDAIASLALQARVALHSGPVTLRENAAADVAQGAKPIEVEGLAKPFAARLLALAAGGQTLVSSSTREALVEAAGDAAPPLIESHGHYRLKGVAEPAEVFELGRPGGPAFTPPPDTDKAYRVVRLERKRGGLWQPVREVPHNLPAERDAFIGRGSELHALAQRLEAGERLVSVLGPGGTGKTRFVRRYALAWLGDWPGGVYFCDLSDARSLDGVLGAVAVGLGVPLAQGDAVAQLGHAIAARGPCLVILDNLEQVLEHAAAAIGRWLDRAGGASFVVTSRERLKIEGETVFPIEPLPVSGDAGDAIELFAARARAQRPDFAIDDGNRAAVAEAVRLLDGLPLAIELAAARVRLLTPAQIVRRLRDRFGLLAGARGTAARQATLRAAIDWSWDLLSTWERAALAQCSVFEGGFTLAAAEGVLDLSAWSDAPPAMDAVQALLDKSLLRAWTNAGRERFDLDEPHFGMYVSIHEYARERLREAGAVTATEQRHGHHFAGFGTPEALDALQRQGGVKRRQALALELDNLVAACRRAIARADATTAAATYGAVWAVLEWQGPIALGVSLGVQVLAISTGEPAIRMLACETLGTAAYHCGDSERAAAWLDEALALARGLADARSEGSILVWLGKLRFDQMRIDEARPLLEAALTVSRAAVDRVSEGQALGRIAALEHHQGRWSEFESRCAAALALFRDVGNRAPESQLLNLLAMRQHDQGHADKALALYGSAADVARECGNRAQEATALGNIGAMFIDQGRLAEALPQLQAALAIHRGVGSRYNEGIVLGNIGSVHEQQGRAAEAGAHYETALAIAREVDNRRHELYLLGSLGALHAGQGRFDAAAACYRSALAMAQAAGYGVSAGRLLAGLAKLQWMQGRFGDAERSLREGEALLRKAGNRIEMPRLLCTRARVELALGRREAAQAALAEAEADADALGVQPTAELRREIDALRREFAFAAPAAPA